MCGIYGIIQEQPVVQQLMSGLSSLSYRGYDSAGIAVISAAGLERRRAEGKLEHLARVLEDSPLQGSVGIAHTRWATHGSPTMRNAHPHMTARVAVVHNGIIENCLSLRSLLESEGYVFHSETDSEVIPLLVTRFLDGGLDHLAALRESCQMLEGSFAIAAVFNDRPDELFAMRRGSPLVLSRSAGGYIVASDANALGEEAVELCYLADGDLAHVSRDRFEITDPDGRRVERPLQPVEQGQRADGKRGYRHYMLKEIHEQPEVIARTVRPYLADQGNRIVLDAFEQDLERVARMSIVACGTSHYAGMVARYWLEGFAGVPVNLDIASEYRYRNAPLAYDELALFISQSGETADTLAALRYAREAGQRCVSVVNVPNSSMAVESAQVLPTLAGPEIGVASTKAFTAQLAVLLLMSAVIARSNRQLDAEREANLLQALQGLPGLMSHYLSDDSDILRIARKLRQASQMIYLGRGMAYPLALEGALKLKEISYIQAEAYPAGELKHGPIALIDEDMPVLMVAPPGDLFDKSLSNLREVAARGGRIILLSDQAGVDQAREFIDDAIVMPDVDPLLLPILYSLPLQLLAYHVALLKGTDVDQPRNLAKSVTVE